MRPTAKMKIAILHWTCYDLQNINEGSYNPYKLAILHTIMSETISKM